MKAAVARDCYIVERTKLALLPLVFVATFSAVAGFLIGDWTAEPRFLEREQSIRDMVVRARADVERVRESIKRGCYDWAIRKREM